MQKGRESNERNADRRAAEQAAKDEGYSGLQAKKDAEARDAWFDRNRPENRDNGGNDKDRLGNNQPFDRNKPVKNPYTDGPDTFPNADAYEDWARERNKDKGKPKDKPKTLPSADGEAGDVGDLTGNRMPKMVAAYGVHKDKMVRARGDLA